jgi:hypothetical protein
VLLLEQDFLAAYIPRADIKLSKKDEPGAVADMEAVDQYHPDDSRPPTAMAGRCFSSALQNQDLPTALSDCNKPYAGWTRTTRSTRTCL